MAESMTRPILLSAGCEDILSAIQQIEEHSVRPQIEGARRSISSTALYYLRYQTLGNQRCIDCDKPMVRLRILQLPRRFCVKVERQVHETIIELMMWESTHSIQGDSR